MKEIFVVNYRIVKQGKIEKKRKINKVMTTQEYLEKREYLRNKYNCDDNQIGFTIEELPQWRLNILKMIQKR